MMGVGQNFFLIFTVWICSHLANAAFNFTNEMASKCKPYYCNSGYDYPNMFEMLGGSTRPGVKLEMHIAIKGLSNGHILLSPVAEPGASDPVYEFVVGAGANTFTEVRRMKQRFGKMNRMTKNILSPLKYTALWIEISDDGVVALGAEGSDIALVSYRDPMPLDIKYFSFAGWGGVELRVLYDCPNANDTITDSSQSVKRQKATSDLLRESLLKDYDRYAVPRLSDRDLIVLDLHYKATKMSFDVAKSIIDVNGGMAMTWIDQKLRWDPEDFGYIGHIQFSNDEIWLPEIMIYDSETIHLLKLEKQLPPTVISTGNVVAMYRVITKTRCAPGPNLVHWPKDDHQCVIRLGLWSQHAMVELRLIDTEQLKGLPNPVRHPVTSQEWNMTEITLTAGWTSHTPYAQLTGEEDEEKTNNHINITIAFSRIGHEYTMLLYTPFASAIVILLITFWIPSSTMTKMSILMFDLILVVGCFTEVLEKLPIDMPRAPHIVRFYVWAMSSIWLSIAVNVLIINLQNKPTRVMNRFLKAFLISTPVTKVLVLPEIKTKDTYNSLREETAAETTPSDDDQTIFWDTLATAIDRAMFIVFIILYAVIFFIHS